MSRTAEKLQMEIGEQEIGSIKLDIKSRDDIPRILRGLQYIYTTKEIREAIFAVLESNILPGVNKRKGRPGMHLWKILVMGILRLDLNCDYDRLHELVNQHKTIRQMLGHGGTFDETSYHIQTIKDNVSLLTEDMLFAINEIIVKAGHKLLSKKKQKKS